MKKYFSVSLQTKVVVLITALLLFVILILTVFYGYIESKSTEQHIGQLAKQVAITVSLMPTVKEAFNLEHPSTVIQPITKKISDEVGAEFIVIGNKDSIRYSHPDENKIGKKMVGGDNDRALKKGMNYISEAVGSLGPSIRGKAPILDEKGEIIGIVSVGFMKREVREVISNRLLKIILISLFVLFLGSVGGVLLARNIRRDTLGLEPHEIASLYRERSAILQSIKEGIIAVDANGDITMMNDSARKILGVKKDSLHTPIETIIPNTKMHRVLETGIHENDKEMLLNEKHVIVNRIPIRDKERIVGVVASFRDKTEIKAMLDTLSEVKKYSEDLRAQTHEFANKLYVLSGMLQLHQYDEALSFIQNEAAVHRNQNQILFQQIVDSKVQAILIGKIGKASEKKVKFTIDSSSSLQPLPKQIGLAQLISVLGNIIDNAFEAVSTSTKKEITFFTTDVGNDIVFEIDDTGNGIRVEDIKHIFHRGYTTKKGKNRGYGLSIVKEIIEELNGTIEIQAKKEGGTIFSIFIPKWIKCEKEDSL
ncbi:sensor histidine kinase [Heyndrickxia oleronia]|uniref:histidine kinase n=1 Tax=Heyndrickxia oleronia TaxID=38875 RepID=A0A8E2LF91_9BACI|nr:sensor histidine kinase [Heyndrickxia oleronia]NYV65141.1 sensor histidine kinase [Bacillus sp. Gen3]MBU5214219.1 sensor histidine kinase [Heyndrickxia oleronia]MCM3452434.1 sensor histidine kinase [Heyndrickxia oleronia]MEC1377092.1 sensor histidine kinase [Heyndrickxia oleronia]OOP69143.1 ATPase [Heyndrickxia oleronia]